MTPQTEHEEDEHEAGLRTHIEDGGVSCDGAPQIVAPAIKELTPHFAQETAIHRLRVDHCKERVH